MQAYSFSSLLESAAAAGISATSGPSRGGRSAATSCHGCDPRAAERGFLHTFEVDERLAIVEQRTKLGILRVGQIAQCLDDEEVRRHPDFELARLRLEAPLRQLAGRCRGLESFQVA